MTQADQATSTANNDAAAAAPALLVCNVGYLPETVKFNFRTKETKNELNEVIKTKRESVELQLPMPTLDGLVDLLNKGDSKAIAGLLGIIKDSIIAQARQQVDDDEKITQATLDTSKLTMDYIFSLPPSQRASTVPDDSLFKLFEKDYMEVMAAVQAEKTTAQISTARDLFLKKFTPVKEKPDVITALRGYLALWYASTTLQEELADLFEYLNKRADALLAAPPKAVDLSAI